MKRFMLIAVALTCTPLGARGQQATAPITFSEYPVGTGISAQYRDRGLLFGGSSPFISTDGSNPTSPVLSGTPRFQGAITGTFVEPGTDRPAIVESFTFDAGYFDEIGSTRIQWFDPHGVVLGQRINSRYGIEPLRCEGGNIASWRIEVVANEPAGYAIDNVTYVPAGPSILFRERSDDQKDGTWGRRDEIPGWDHSALQIDGAVYESHPGYAAGTYVSADGQESRSVVPLDGVQSVHSRKTFLHDSTTSVTAVTATEELPIARDVAAAMRDRIALEMGKPFAFIDVRTLDGALTSLAPSRQKGGGGAYTCVGLVEWAAEQAGRNGGQGFVPNWAESFSVVDPRQLPAISIIEVPLLSPSLLNWAMKGQDLFANAQQWLQGLLDPVDMMITDPLGRRMGFTAGTGLVSEIPNARYSGDGKLEQFVILNPIPGEYLFDFTGVGADAFAAMATADASDGFQRSLAQGETLSRRVVVSAKPGTTGDVNGDGAVDADDVVLLSQRLNRFTDRIGHPGDLDGDGLLSQADVDLLSALVARLENHAPTAAPSGVPATGKAPLAVRFAANASDPDGDVLSYTWHFGDAGSADDTSTLANPTHVYATPGTFTAVVTVSDGRLSTSQSLTITVTSPLVVSTRVATVSTAGIAAVWVDFDGPAPQAGDVVEVTLDGIRLLAQPFSAFKRDPVTGIDVFAGKTVQAWIDLPRRRVSVAASGLSLDGLSPADGVDVGLAFGRYRATENVPVSPVAKGVLLYRRPDVTDKR